jgi:UDP-2,3-diacylglucosamine hydrolase
MQVAQNKRLVFISDLHLNEEQPELTTALCQYLSTLSRYCSALYVLGDLFNFWLGDDDIQAWHLPIIKAFRKLKDEQTDIFLMHGNRDFLIGEDFATQTGISILKAPTVVESGKVRALLMHGDELCTLDNDYQKFRRTVRNANWQREFLDKPLMERRAFAVRAREASRTMNSTKPSDIMDVTAAEVIRVMEVAGVNLLIHGHTHRPGRHKLELTQGCAERVVLGDWGDRGWYAELSHSELILESFLINK